MDEAVQHITDGGLWALLVDPHGRELFGAFHDKHESSGKVKFRLTIPPSFLDDIEKAALLEGNYTYRTSIGHPSTPKKAPWPATGWRITAKPHTPRADVLAPFRIVTIKDVEGDAELAARVKAGADVAASYREWLQVLHEPEEEGSEEEDADEAAEDEEWYNAQAAEADAQMEGEEEDT